MEAKIRAYTVKELRYLYGSDGRPISWKTWNAWIDPIREQLGPIRGRKLTPRQVRLVFDCCDRPE